MTFREKFDELKAKYGTIDETKLTDNFAVQIELNDEDCGGIFYVAYMNSPFAVEPYDYRDNTAAINVSSKLLEDILSCKADPMEAYFSGELKVEGNAGHALMVVELMKKEPEKKTAASEKVKEKKTEAKDKEVKKPAKKKTTTAKTTETKKTPAKKKTVKKTEE